MTTFIDTNVIIYLLDATSPFHDWAKAAAAKRRTEGPLIISDIVYSEASVTLASLEDTDEAFASLAVERLRFSTSALFRAGKAYAEYRRRGGLRPRMLADFLIGAQAETEGAPLMTVNSRDFGSLFPSVVLMHPDNYDPQT
jgi:predicted nucleic acid-binding protein